MKKLMKNLEGVEMNTNKILITGLREGHQINRAKKSYRSMPLSYPTIFLTGFLLLLAFSIPVSAENPNSAQWESVGGEMILSGDHKFTTSWASDRYSRSKGLYWQGSFYLPHKERKYTPWENTVKNSVAPKKGQITVRGPGNVGRFQRTKVAKIYMRNTETGSGFVPWSNDLQWFKDMWHGSVKDFNPEGVPSYFSGYIPAEQVVTLDVEAHMTSYDNMMISGEYSFRAPQEVEYEVWFFPREGGEVINVSKYGPDVPEFTWSTIEPGSNFIIEPDTDLKYSHPPVDILSVDVIGGSETTYEKYTEMLKAGVAPEEVWREMQKDERLALVMESDMHVFEDYFLGVCVKGLEGAAWAGRPANFILGCGTGTTGTFSSVLDAFYAYADRRIQAVEDGKSLDEAHELGISAAGRKAFENLAWIGFSKYKHFGEYKQRLFNTVKQTLDLNLFDPINTGQVKVNIPSSDISGRSVPPYVPPPYVPGQKIYALPKNYYQPVWRPPQ